MKPALKSWQQIPYGGLFRIKDRQTGIVIQSKTANSLYPKMIQHRKANGVPMGIGFKDEVEQWICEEYPQECENIDPDRPVRRSLGLADVVHGTRVMAAFTIAGKPLVTQEEAERRAGICAQCPWNQAFSKPCAGICAELQNLVLAIVGNKATSHDNDLMACGICGCFLRASVWLPLTIQCKGTTAQMRKQFANVGPVPTCWKQCP